MPTDRRVPNASRVLFMEFVVELIDFDGGFGESSLASRRDSIDSAPTSSGVVRSRFEEAGALKPMKQRVERAGTDAVAVMLQFFHHAETEDRLLRGVQQHMNANQAVEEFASMIRHRVHCKSKSQI